ncbi:MAG: tRNA 2-thiouridine(34) synthase MnmA, partial [Candidatus Aminicenantes bacterium]|nr:tRNA 2-thiouridine(34) synthase MnmA [Candidatus Aminicenantes bacterium]
RIAAKLGIDHLLLDVKQAFSDKVVADFLSEYSRGRTPNPCIRCNEFIKFGVLMENARRLGANFLATGHHARVESENASGRYLLKKGFDRHKDQSYFLYRLTQDQLAKTLFPVGDITKAEVREIARSFGLPAAQRPESQEVCFIPDNDYIRFLEERIPLAFRRGPILDVEGKVLGEHEGIVRFTVGQRRGLKISAAQPLYVIEIRPEKNEIVVGPNNFLYKNELLASDVHLVSQSDPEGALSVKAKIRYRHSEAGAAVTFLDSGRARVVFDRPQRAVTPGQAVVFFEGDTVLGGGTIMSTGGASC